MLDFWQQFLREQGATLGGHAGALTCSSFADDHGAQVQALRARPIPRQDPQQIADLSYQGVLAVRGKDAIKFLQGYLTCDVPSLGNGPAAGALCNLQGRMTSNFIAFLHEDGVLLRMHRSLVAPTQTVLAKYIVFSKAQMTDESDRWVRLGIAGPGVAQTIAQFTPSATQGALALALMPGARYELWLPPYMAQATWLTLREHARPADVWAWEGLDVIAGRAWLTATTANEYLPQMFNLDALGAINFSKGCYLGQEIVTRAQHRGGVKRRLVLGTCSAAGMQIGDAVHQGDKVVGQIVAIGRVARAMPGGDTNGESNRVVDTWVANAVIGRDAAALPLSVRNASFALENLPYSLGT